MLMPGMLRRFPPVVLALVLLFAAEPLLHMHPLQSNASSATCAVCATGLDRPVDMPVVVVSLDVIDVIDDAPIVAIRATASLLVASRAPPAA